MREHYTEAPEGVRRQIQRLLQTPEYRKLAVRDATAAGYRVDETDIPQHVTECHRVIAQGAADGGASFAEHNGIAIADEADAREMCRALVNNGFAAGSRAEEEAARQAVHAEEQRQRAVARRLDEIRIENARAAEMKMQRQAEREVEKELSQ